MNLIRNRLARLLLIAVVLTGLTLGSGCGDNFSLTAFRDAAAGSLTDAFSTFAEGLAAGFFAGLNPEGSDSGGTGQSAPTTG